MGNFQVGMPYSELKKLETCEHYGNKGRRKLYSGLLLEFYPKDIVGNKVYVCGTCYLPFGTQVALRAQECDCGEIFSSPWELRCKKCHGILFSDVSMEGGRVVVTPHDDAPPYMDWWWLRDRLREKRLTYARRRPTQPVGKRESREKKFDEVPMFRYARQ